MNAIALYRHYIDDIMLYNKYENTQYFYIDLERFKNVTFVHKGSEIYATIKLQITINLKI